MDVDKKQEIVLKGIAASSGVVHGPAYLFLHQELDVPKYIVSEDRREEEISKFESALVETRKQLSSLRNEIEEKLGEDEAFILDAHLMVLEDRALIEETEKGIIDTGYNVEHCFHNVAARYIEAFSNMDDTYFRERVSDIRDVSRRVLNNLLGLTDNVISDSHEPKVLVCNDLLPSDISNVQGNNVMAVVSDLGGRTSHAVIMARSMNVPAVVGLGNVTELVSLSDEIIVDGYDGIVIVNPSEQSLYKYGKLSLEKKTIKERFETALYQTPETIDGKTLHVQLNVEGFESDEFLKNSGASGIGLFRTEALFLKDKNFPDEEEQFHIYKRVCEAFPDADVVIRTLDLGGDKNPHGGKFGYDEANPFMGFRAIRFCLEEPGIFKEQFRAILRASAFGNLKIMYPMITSVSEVVRANELLEEARDELREAGIEFDTDIDVGIMVETPAAMMTADLLAEHADFFSIGTNDLIQYLLAVDRVNNRIAHMYEPNHPSVIRSLKHIFDAANKAGIPACVCGEMAGDPANAALLFALGASHVSVSASVVADIKYMIRNMRLEDAKLLADKIIEEADAEKTMEALREYYNQCIDADYKTIS